MQQHETEGAEESSRVDSVVNREDWTNQSGRRPYYGVVLQWDQGSKPGQHHARASLFNNDPLSPFLNDYSPLSPSLSLSPPLSPVFLLLLLKSLVVPRLFHDHHHRPMLASALTCTYVPRASWTFSALSLPLAPRFTPLLHLATVSFSLRASCWPR